MIVPALRELLGEDVLFLKWPLRKKGTPRKWGHLTVASMTPKYLNNLESGNIGVALGAVSGGLVVVDVDMDELVPAYLAVNPTWAGTLRTRGARGCAFWLRMSGDYPQKTKTLKTHSREEAGEWRAGKNTQSIIHGIHPDGHPYQILKRAKPIVVDFKSIVWPTAIANPPSLSNQLGGELNSVIHRDTETQRLSNAVTHETQDTQDTQDTHVVCALGCVVSVDHAVELALPKKDHSNHHHLFILARAVKSLELNRDKFSVEELRDVFNRWHIRATPFLRKEQTRDDYMMEFMEAYARARVPLGEGPVKQAWIAAQRKPLPPEAIATFTDEQPRLLVALCRELQIRAGSDPFFLGAREVQKVMNLPSHTTAARWMKALCVLGIIEEIEKGKLEKGKKPLSSSYRYKGILTP